MCYQLRPPSAVDGQLLDQFRALENPMVLLLLMMMTMNGILKLQLTYSIICLIQYSVLSWLNSTLSRRSNAQHNEIVDENKNVGESHLNQSSFVSIEIWKEWAVPVVYSDDFK